MIDEFISEIEQLQADGAVVLLKWDGERQANRITVVVTRQATDYVWRKNSDNLSCALQEALHDYKAKHAHLAICLRTGKPTHFLFHFAPQPNWALQGTPPPVHASATPSARP